jgi:hypothetical protein
MCRIFVIHDRETHLKYSGGAWVRQMPDAVVYIRSTFALFFRETWNLNRSQEFTIYGLAGTIYGDDPIINYVGPSLRFFFLKVTEKDPICSEKYLISDFLLGKEGRSPGTQCLIFQSRVPLAQHSQMVRERTGLNGGWHSDLIFIS